MERQVLTVLEYGKSVHIHAPPAREVYKFG